MKLVTLPAGGILTGLAAMLALMGHDTDDASLALRMEAPYLLVHEEGQYRTGARLYHPRWINLYLNSIGFRLVCKQLPCADVESLLRSLPTAMVTLRFSRQSNHPAVFTSYAGGLYEFVNIKGSRSPEPDALSLSKPMLKRRLDPVVRVHHLERCEPVAANYVPLLLQTLDNLAHYQRELLAARELTVTRAQLQELHTPLFRALMTDMLPMMALTGDGTLAEELRLLQHDYTHIFTPNSPKTVPLSERLPASAIVRCLSWFREDVIDRLAALGGDEVLLAARAYPE